MATNQKSALKQSKDITECPVCFESFSDPRSLPCVHTFCLKCITDYGHDTQPGDQMPCPICSKEFTIPSETGLSGLPKNFFVEKMLQIKQVTNIEKTVQCEVCEAQSKEETEKTKATKYCVECQQKLCDCCAKAHETYKILRDHKLISLKDLKGPRGEEIFRTSLPSTGCQKHRDQSLAIFCNDCKVAACVVCYIASHKQHDCSDIDDVIAKFRKQMTADVGSLDGGVEKLDEILTYVDQLKKDLTERAAETEENLLAKADELHERIEQNKQALINELATKKDNVMKQLNALSHEVKQRTSFVENLKTYTGELCSKGAAGDVARETSVLHNRAEELLNFDVIVGSRNRMDSIKVELEASALTNGNSDNLIGDIILQVVSKAMVLAHVVPNGRIPVGGVTSLDNELYVVRETAQQQIEVYDSTTFALIRNLPVNSLPCASGLTSCAVNKCLYVSNYNNNWLHRVDLSNNSAKYWSVGAHPAGLSINSASNVLVTCYQGNCVQEYTTQGTMIRQISFQSGISNPWWVIQIANDQFAVSSLHRVCIVDDKGVVTQSYGNPSVAGSAPGQLNTPFGLIRVRNGSFLVADSGNNRLILLSPTLDRTLAVSLPIDGGLQCPRALCFNESRGRLFVGEYNGRRVLIFDDVYCNEF